jgi:carboxymethylenebutenolidase
MSEWTEIKTADGAFKAYVAKPSGAPRGAVVVIQEIFGVNAVMRGKADWLAREGYLALCPDLFWRIEPGIELTDKTEAEWKRAFELFGQYNKDKGVDDIQATIKAARNMGAGKVGAIGYCLGGLMAYLTATRTDADASVGYYGVAIDTKLDEAKNIKKPLLLHVAGQDEFVPPASIEAMKAGLPSNPLVTLDYYPERNHAFTREGGKNYDAADAKRADGRTIDFFRANIG